MERLLCHFVLYPCMLPPQNRKKPWARPLSWLRIGNRPNTVLENTVSNTKLSEFFWPLPSSGERTQRVPLSLFLCAKANSPSFLQKSPTLPQNSVSSLFRNSALETVVLALPREHAAVSLHVLVPLLLRMLVCLYLWCKTKKLGFPCDSTRQVIANLYTVDSRFLWQKLCH